MKLKNLSLVILMNVAFIPVYATAAEAIHWGYTGDTGPEFWGSLSEEFHLCSVGLQQSPVDIATELRNELPEIEYHYKPEHLVIENNSHTIEVHYRNNSYIEIDEKKYELLQFHFHSPSEHTNAGMSFAMEMHLVHINSSGQIAVIGVLIDEGDKNQLFAGIIENAPLSAGTIDVVGEEINAAELLPDHKGRYYAYSGSLTTPPCSEGVRWFVLKNRISVSREQIDQFLGLVHENARPTQALHGRSVIRNK